jgi:hypothetical protein
MTGEEIHENMEHLARLIKAAQQKSGDGTAWDVTFPNGENHRYIFRNIRSLVEVKFNVETLLKWIWDVKDLLKHRARAKGLDERHIENVCYDDPHLTLCGVLANWLRHGKPKSRREGKFARLGEVRFMIPQSAIRSITFRSFEVDMDINDPSGVELQMPIIDKGGNEIGDAFEYASAAIHRLELLRDEIELSA